MMQADRKSNHLIHLAGPALFAIMSLVAFVRLLTHVPGHYRVFTSAVRALWSGTPAYGTDFGTQVGYWFYSPACGLLFFAPFAWLPETLGLALYMALSLGVFVAGSRAMLGAALPDAPDRRSAYWALAAAPVFTGILASKLEILMTGILLGALAWLVEPPGSRPSKSRRRALSAALLSMILCWKFQPIATLGLVSIALVRHRRDWRWPALLATMTAGWFALPFALRPTGYLLEQHALWSSTLGEFVRASFLDFENVFAFAHHGFGLPMPFAATQVITGLLALALAIRVATARGTDAREAILLAAGLGAGFAVLVSPLGQNNALVLVTPLLLAALSARARATDLALAAAALIFTFGYSDLLPLGLREASRAMSFKIVGTLALTAVLCACPPRTSTRTSKV